MTDPLLTRDLIASGGIAALVARDAPGLDVLSDAQRAASLRDTLERRPGGDVWLFGYGSLIWNPTIRAEERRTGCVGGWHRAFCLSSVIGRGTQANPGLTLALDEGGTCSGVAYRLAEHELEDELALVWRREMVSGAYVPRWMALNDAQGVAYGHAIAFTVDRASRHYAGGLAPEETVRRLATARGAIGTAAEYLYRTCAGLHASGIPDAELDALAERVAAYATSLAPAEETAPGAEIVAEPD